MDIDLASTNKINIQIQERTKQSLGEPACIPPLNFLIVMKGKMITILSIGILSRHPIEKLRTNGKNEIRKHDAAYSYSSLSSSDIVFVFISRFAIIEKGANNTTLDMLTKICEILKTTPDYFMLGNMRTNNIPQNIMDCLLLCTEEDIELIDYIVKQMAERNQNRFSKKHV